MSGRTSCSSAKKDESHRRIVREAAKLVRSKGFDGTGVVEVMTSAGLTHGGFYAHFHSKDALLAEAVAAGGTERLHDLRTHLQDIPKFEQAHRLIMAYLTGAESASGVKCPIASLGSELPRQSKEVRHAATQHVQALLALLAQLEDGSGRWLGTDRAAAVFSAMVGAVVVSRAVSDRELARTLLDAAAQNILRLLD